MDWIDSKQVKLILREFDCLDKALLTQISEILEEIQSNTEEFQVGFKGLNVTPNWKRPRELWIGFDQKSKKKLNKLSDNLNEKLIQRKIASNSQSTFHPQLTIAKWNDVPTPYLNHNFIKEFCFYYLDVFPSFAFNQILITKIDQNGEEILYTSK